MYRLRDSLHLLSQQLNDYPQIVSAWIREQYLELSSATLFTMWTIEVNLNDTMVSVNKKPKIFDQLLRFD